MVFANTGDYVLSIVVLSTAYKLSVVKVAVHKSKLLSTGTLDWIFAGGAVVMVALFPLLYSRNVPCLTLFAFQAIYELQMLGAKICVQATLYTVYT